MPSRRQVNDAGTLPHPVQSVIIHQGRLAEKEAVAAIDCQTTAFENDSLRGLNGLVLQIDLGQQNIGAVFEEEAITARTYPKDGSFETNWNNEARSSGSHFPQTRD